MLKQGRMTILLVIIALIATACGGDSESTPDNQTAEAESVSIQLGWLHNMEYSGFYVADAQGLYEEQNLDVDILEGGFDDDGNFISPLDEVVNGNADFGVLSGDQLLVERANGSPLVAVATIYQRSPIAFVSLVENDITGPQDFIGKTAAISPETSTGLIFFTLLSEVGIDQDDINIIDRIGGSDEQMLNGEADFIGEFITNEPYASEPENFNIVLASDYGVDLYANVIFTTEDTIANRPEVVERFLKASAQGYQQALDDPEGATDELLKITEGLDRDEQLASMQSTVPLVNPPGANILSMSADVWQFTYESLVNLGMLDEAFDVEEAFDTTFVDKVYAEE